MGGKTTGIGNGMEGKGRARSSPQYRDFLLFSRFVGIRGGS